MTHTQDPNLVVRYEGTAVGTEIWGMVQANFLVGRRHAPGREVAVNLNAAAARFLASTLGREDSPAFRDEVARVAGDALLRTRLAEQSDHMGSIFTISRGTFDEHPELLATLRAHFGA